MNVVSIENYRPNDPKDLGKSPVMITLCAPSFAIDDVPIGLTINIRVENGDFRGILDTIKDNGGIWTTVDDDTIWFLPWPPAAVRITMLRDN
jgi:hypothetical protein